MKKMMGSAAAGMNPNLLFQTILRRCASWGDFAAQLAARTDKEKGDLFEELTRACLLLEPGYRTRLAHVWLLREVPHSIRERLGLPAEDKGIDLVAETKGGEYWAVQCKYRADTAHNLTFREISTFGSLTFGVCRGFSFGLICSTTERITEVVAKQENLGLRTLDAWQDLDAEFFREARELGGKRAPRPTPLAPRPHQKAVLRDAVAHYVKHKARRGKLIMPCGSGKSLAAYWIAERLGAKRILVAVPSLALIRQTLKVWSRESVARGREVDWRCVCSDETAGQGDRDDVSVLRQDLGVPCLTDVPALAHWLKGARGGRTVVFTTYQSGEVLARAARRASFTFDLAIFDEAHKTVGARDKLFSHLLSDRNLSARRRLFMTATERRYQGDSDEVLSMEDPKTYGETFHQLSFRKALEYKPPILSDYKILTLFVSREEVADLIRSNAFVRPKCPRWPREVEAEMLASLIALRKAMAEHPIRHAVNFHGSIRRAELFKAHNEAYSRAFPRQGRPAVFHVSGKTPTGTRSAVLKEYAENHKALITNARCLTEGVDVPGIDCVLIADPRRSAVDIVQAVGRALRPAKGNPALVHVGRLVAKT
jgi:predicted helicase